MSVSEIKAVLEKGGKPMTATQIYEKAVSSKIIIVGQTTNEQISKMCINGVLSRDIRNKGINSDFIKTSTEPNTYFLNGVEIANEIPKRESVASLSNAPSAKKVKNLVEKIQLEKLNVSTERELELVMWGAISAKWPEWIKYRPSFGGRTCDVGLGSIAVEMKYIKNISDKDRLVGQILDYLKDVDEVVVVAIDEKGYLKNSSISSLEDVSIVFF